MVIKNRDGEDMGTCHAQAKEEPPRKKNTYYPQKKKDEEHIWVVHNSIL